MNLIFGNETLTYSALGSVALALSWALWCLAKNVHRNVSPYFDGRLVFAVLLTAAAGSAWSATCHHGRDPSFTDMPTRPSYGDSDHANTLRSINYEKQLEVWERHRKEYQPAPQTQPVLPPWTWPAWAMLFSTGLVATLARTGLLIDEKVQANTRGR